MSLIKDFGDFTHTPWDIIWNKGIVEFFNIIAFIKEYNRRQQKHYGNLRK